ncbi:MAG TPA: YlxR family protein [Enterococcus sp.]|nr:YlxR family protein [Enterococcus sp.]
MVAKRKVPLRKCLASGEMKPKKEMIRLVRNKEKQVFVDLTGKQNGRGAYVTIDEAVILQAKAEKVFDRVFGVQIEDDIYEELLNIAKEQ